MKEPLISIIMPAHNAERTLARAVESIHHELSGCISYEILIIENGSTDHTEEVAENLRSDTVLLFHSPKGVSNARNVGIMEASGIWVMFVDADDALAAAAGNALLEATQQEADLCLFGYYVGNKEIPFKMDCTKSSLKICEEMLRFPTRYMTVWAKLFKRKIIIQNRIEFDNRLRLAEDSDFLLQYLENCNRIEGYNRLIYQYTTNSSSVMHTVDGSKVMDYAKSMEITKEKLGKMPQEVKEIYWQYVLTHFHVAMVNDVFSVDNTNAFKQKKKNLQEASEISIFRNAVWNTKGQQQSKANKVLGILLRKRWYFAAGMIYQVRALQKKAEEMQ